MEERALHHSRNTVVELYAHKIRNNNFDNIPIVGLTRFVYPNSNRIEWDCYKWDINRRSP